MEKLVEEGASPYAVDRCGSAAWRGMRMDTLLALYM
jgi:hypothetical protein